MKDLKVIIDDIEYVPRHFNLPKDWLDIIVANKEPGYILSDHVVSEEIITEAQNVKCVNDVRGLFKKLFSLNYQEIHRSEKQKKFEKVRKEIRKSFKEHGLIKQKEFKKEEIKETKYMEIKEFRQLGFLQEVNRCFLHPLGLALVVRIKNDNTEELAGIQDYRENSEGLMFNYKDRTNKEIIEVHKKMELVKKLWDSKQIARKHLFDGHVIEQPFIKSDKDALKKG